MTIQEAKSSLYDKLSHYDAVVGAAIHGHTFENDDSIVIFLSKKSNKVIKQIPSIYEGYKVTYDIQGKIRAL